ncbi:hypothetical protein QLQ12_36620 [Actinoplanes sp. NEAU-A12]|uniref:DUF2207 domain-containing protein n=1 Tax=Actinoplanes sandaracinus TaxID=3045177 RepID=A0ABT6WWL1_9ACTN|nr:hypothetical protein [Actinoplanes sandaracinus]MDI6104131.1 hypothetical protein [Actinoplanes sandaracinus]
MTEWDADARQVLITDGNAYVDTQIGVLHGDAHIYQVAGNATPEEQFRVAVNYLHGGLPDEARRRIRTAVMESGLRSAEVAYRWTLAVLSGRRLADLDADDFAALDHAFAMAEDQPSGRFWRCTAVIQRFVGALSDIGPDGRPNPLSCAEAMRCHAELPENDRVEIERHLDQFLAHILEDDAEQHNSERVRAARMAGDRRTRVPKFFEPDPAPPVRKVPVPTPPGTAWRPLAAAAGIALFALWVLLAALAEVSVLAVLLVPVLLGTGGWYAGRHLMERAYLRSRRDAKEAELVRGERSAIERPGNSAPEEGFTETVTAMIDAAFSQRQPADHRRDAFWRETWGLRAALHGDLVDLYAFSGLPAASVAWLVNHHADDIARRWKAGGLDDFRHDRATAPMAPPAFLGGLTALVGAAVISVLTLLGSQFFALLLTAGMLYAAARVGRHGAMVLYGERRRIALDTAEFDRRWEAEQTAHQRRVAWLADRPTDVEMGQWLALDLAYFKRGAMVESRLTSQEVFTHVILTEAAPGTVRARFVGGPFRHSAYTVLLFLLTGGGVRKVQARLEFASGKFVGEQRENFQYRSIVTAKVKEVSVRFDDGQPRVLSDDAEAVQRDKVVRREALELALFDGSKIRVLVDHFGAETIDRLRESPEDLAGLARESSGVSGALRVLEAVAGEGKEWIALELGRTYRRLARRRSMPSAEQTRRITVPPTPRGPHHRQAPGETPGTAVRHRRSGP